MTETLRGDGAGLPDPGTAAAALARADQAQAAVRHGSSWAGRYFVAYGVASTLFMLVVPLWGSTGTTPATVAVFGTVALWFVFVACAKRYVRRQRVSLRGHDRATAVAFAGWLVLWAIAWTVGPIFFAGQPAFWVPAALIVAVPFFLGARLAVVRR